jgi:hypothetical protein
MKELKTEIIINAPTTKVWQVLLDFENYPNWNPFIKNIAGATTVGGQLKAFIQPPDAGGMTFKPTVLVSDTDQEFRWLGKLLFRGLFDGEHYFLLKDLGNGTTQFIHGERFSGILVPLFGGILKKSKQGFELMNAALKKQCESEWNEF